MSIDNLKILYDMLSEHEDKANTWWVIVHTSKNFSKPLKIGNFAMLYPVNYINIDFEIEQVDSEVLKEFIKRIEYYKKIEAWDNKHYYFLEFKAIKPEQVGHSLLIPDILDDLLNILTLYYNRYFIIFPFDIFLHFEISEKYKKKIKIKGINYNDVEESSEGITNNFNILGQLRQEQFYLIEKSMKLYSNSLYSNETNPSIALCFLISSIEVLAQKYGRIPNPMQSVFRS